MRSTPVVVTMEGLIMAGVCTAINHGIDVAAVREAVRDFVADDHVWRTIELATPRLIATAIEAEQMATAEPHSKPPSARC